MKTSKAPVVFANRAEMIELDSHAFSVCADVPENQVCLNLYAQDGTRVISMTADEAKDLARTILQGAHDLSEKTADADFIRELKAKQSRERNERGA
jgi:hypothetical protein